MAAGPPSPLTSASFFLAMAPAPTPRRCIPPWARGPPRCRDPGRALPGIRRPLPNAEAPSLRHLRAPEAARRLPSAGRRLPSAPAAAALPGRPTRAPGAACASHPRGRLGLSSPRDRPSTPTPGTMSPAASVVLGQRGLQTEHRAESILGARGLPVAVTRVLAGGGLAARRLDSGIGLLAP